MTVLIFSPEAVRKWFFSVQWLILYNFIFSLSSEVFCVTFLWPFLTQKKASLSLLWKARCLWPAADTPAIACWVLGSRLIKRGTVLYIKTGWSNCAGGYKRRLLMVEDSRGKVCTFGSKLGICFLRNSKGLLSTETELPSRKAEGRVGGRWDQNWGYCC